MSEEVKREVERLDLLARFGIPERSPGWSLEEECARLSDRLERKQPGSKAYRLLKNRLAELGAGFEER